MLKDVGAAKIPQDLGSETLNVDYLETIRSPRALCSEVTPEVSQNQIRSRG